MHGPGCEVGEERPIRCQRLVITNPVDGLSGDVGGEMVIGIVRWVHPSDAVIYEWCPLVRFAAKEAVELVKARVSGPAITGRRG